MGIYSVELYLQVRLACADGMSQRAAAKRFNVSRDTVRKMLSFSSPPGYRRQSVPQRPKLDGFVAVSYTHLDVYKRQVQLRALRYGLAPVTRRR